MYLNRNGAIAAPSWNSRCEKSRRSDPGFYCTCRKKAAASDLLNKIKAYELQDNGLDTVEANRKLGFAADSRDYDFAARALKALGIRSVRLLSNNPDKIQQLERAGIRVVERIPCRPRTSQHSQSYLRTKKNKLGHLLAGL